MVKVRPWRIAQVGCGIPKNTDPKHHCCVCALNQNTDTCIPVLVSTRFTSDSLDGQISYGRPISLPTVDALDSTS